MNINGNPVYLLYANPRQTRLKPLDRMNFSQNGFFVALEATLDGIEVGVRAGPYIYHLDPRFGYDAGCW